jgi:hypothetical protein
MPLQTFQIAFRETTQPPMPGNPPAIDWNAAESALLAIRSCWEDLAKGE